MHVDEEYNIRVTIKVCLAQNVAFLCVQCMLKNKLQQLLNVM